MSFADAVAANDRRFVTAARMLSPADWRQPSLCTGWSNHDVLAHLVAGCSVGLGSLAGRMATNRASFDRANDSVTFELAASRRPDQLLDDYEALIPSLRGIGRLFPKRLLLGDHVLHEIDIFLALGSVPTFDSEAVRSVLRTEVTIPNPFVPAKRTARGLRLIATDVAWTWGDPTDPGVAGSGWAIASALAHRSRALPHLDGQGVEVLAERLGANSH